MRNLVRALAFFRPDGTRLITIILLMILSIALNILKPWPMALLVDSVLGGKALPSYWPKSFANWPPATQLLVLIGGLLAVHVGHASISAIQNYMAIGVGLRGLQRVRNEVFAWLQRLSLRFHHGTEAGDIIFRAGTDTCAFPSLLQQGLFIIISALFTLGFMMVVMIRLNLQLALYAIAVVPLLILAIRMFSREMRNRGLVAQQAESKVYALIHQGIAALPLTQSYTRERHEQRRFIKHTDRAQRHKMSQHGLEVFYWFVISLLLVLDTAVVTWFGARLVLSSQLTLGELLVFLAYLGQMFDPLNQLSLVGATVSSASASIGRVFEILDAPDEVKDAPTARQVHSGRPGPHRKPDSLRVDGNIKYDDVSFGYADSHLALHEVSFELRAGESVAVIGPSGAGKTTLLNLLPRFFDPGSGAVILEGADLRELRVKDLRAQIALVLQEPIILPTTLAENISYGRHSATTADIEAAARAANAHDFISQLPLRYQTVVGEGGTRLSVGERQRINLARAFLKDAPILVMDEPTSALDVESEALVVESLAQLMRGRTTLMVAHRLTTIQQVDKILVLESGTVAEFGTPEELLARPSYYARVVNGQVQLNHEVRC
jgi:ATP-binding cassette subfamily B protein/subfamily B ATP-binding cassette protein MsbA